MDKQSDTSAQKLKTSNAANRKFSFFLIHGYTGSPTDFNGLEDALRREFDADVIIPVLPGHGTTVHALEGIAYEDFFHSAEAALQDELRKERKIILGGVSFGAQLALALAAKYPVEAILNVSAPYGISFPLNTKLAGRLALLKTHWKKIVPKREKFLRAQSARHKTIPSYAAIPSRALSIIKTANNHIRENLHHISAPYFGIYSTKDFISDYRCMHEIEKRISSRVINRFLIKKYIHNLFFSSAHDTVVEAITTFLKVNTNIPLAVKKNRSYVAAIVPAYEEETHIGATLNALTSAPILDEIIVIDDGSHDNTESVVRKFKNVTYLKNVENKGKGYSMERGVHATTADIIFFCDADITNLTPSIIEHIIQPVLRGTHDMFIGIRNNVMQKSFLPFALNSGERALRREIWDSLPPYYKYRYRVEVGLNIYTKRLGYAVGHKVFSHYQTLKESKYGFFRGTVLRWRMNFDVVMAFLHIIFIHPTKKRDLKK